MRSAKPPKNGEWNCQASDNWQSVLQNRAATVKERRKAQVNNNQQFISVNLRLITAPCNCRGSDCVVPVRSFRAVSSASRAHWG